MSEMIKYFTWYDWVQSIGSFIVLFLLSVPVFIVMVIWVLWMWRTERGIFNRRLNACYDRIIEAREKREWPYDLFP